MNPDDLDVFRDFLLEKFGEPWENFWTPTKRDYFPFQEQNVLGLVCFELKNIEYFTKTRKQTIPAHLFPPQENDYIHPLINFHYFCRPDGFNTNLDEFESLEAILKEISKKIKIIVNFIEFKKWFDNFLLEKKGYKEIPSSGAYYSERQYTPIEDIDHLINCSISFYEINQQKVSLLTIKTTEKREIFEWGLNDLENPDLKTKLVRFFE